ncbi:MAG: hypothetical protein ABJN75_00165 [Hoeflea sp.]|uniref:hypothetical protein n=1 Tax=Hoeflea sp. TaxID=1940281 RepID=UPI003298A5BB|tara:strand:+ start:11841 stop:11999 length:159 start_codon:yes stop_codon:yes gene_type:complete
MTLSPRLLAGLAAAAAIAVVIAANWQFVSLATGSHPGCVPVTPAKPAAAAGC